MEGHIDVSSMLIGGSGDVVSLEKYTISVCYPCARPQSVLSYLEIPKQVRLKATKAPSFVGFGRQDYQVLSYFSIMKRCLPTLSYLLTCTAFFVFSV